MGVFSLTNLDLPKKVKYKKRRRKYNKERRELSLLKGRSYNDFVFLLLIILKCIFMKWILLLVKEMNKKFF